MDKIKKLQEKRAQIWERAKEIMDRAETEGRELTVEERENVNKAFRDMDDIKAQIQVEERAAALAKEFEKSQIIAGKQNPENEETRTGTASQEYKSAFWKALRHTKNALDPHEYRALNVGVGEEGGYTVPDEFERQLIQALEEENVMRGLANVIQTTSGTREIPVVTDRGTAFWTTEAAEYQESDHVFDQVTLSAYKLTTLIKVTEELLNDSAFNLEQYIINQFALRIGKKEEESFIVGDGSGKPTGVINTAQIGKETAATNAIVADEIFELYHSLRRPYRPKAAFLMHDSTALAIRVLKDSTGQYIWQPGLQAGQPDRLLGRPVFVSEFMPEIGAGKKVIAFGDFSNYWIADRTGTAIQRLIELYATNGMVGFRAFKRVDGKLVLPEAVKVLKCKLN